MKKTNNLKNKLKSRRGFTLTEMIITTAIMMLVAVAIANGMAATAQIYQRMTLDSEASVLSGTLSVEIAHELRRARNIRRVEADGSFIFDSVVYGEGVIIDTDDKGRARIGDRLILPSRSYLKDSDDVKTQGLQVEITYKLTDIIDPAAPAAPAEDKGFDVNIRVFAEKFDIEKISSFLVVPLEFK